MIWRAALVVSLAMSACAPTPPTPEQAAQRCEERARAAQGPEVGLTIGANSESGPFASGSIGITSDFVRGADPLAIYESCVMNLTGQPPIRPPRLRAI
ncbi:hypothetical protein [Yoonia sediminilitoris]|uniref:Lipoprotein n=1 Tax=Yoonia sediminilitoris TaxID=1286148 RepID=A0A2T6KKC0_9RHOB|nr:hypothetical protein [Yoonia sediminilitoris]PUB16385.1 hypothetical protein C8N45_103240 [Yoonia sediminilitoris]RCW96734.1 hypothetical protein DFP92_103240 [Yoonia sediminilitoris]